MHGLEPFDPLSLYGQLSISGPYTVLMYRACTRGPIPYDTPPEARWLFVLARWPLPPAGIYVVVVVVVVVV